MDDPRDLCPDCLAPTGGGFCDDCGDERDYIAAEEAGELPYQQPEEAEAEALRED